jgi:hypothetical protein
MEMSLCQALNTCFGIVMAADHRVMTTVGTLSKTTFLLTDHAKKLFLTAQGYGVAYCGAASIGGRPVQYYLEQEIAALPGGLSPESTAVCLAKKLKARSDENVILITAGYDQGEAFICSTNTQAPDAVMTQKTFGPDAKLGVVYAGRDDIANLYYQSKKLSFDYAQFTLEDAAGLLSYVNYSVAAALRFSQSAQDVSFDCDVLTLTPGKAAWSRGCDHLPR